MPLYELDNDKINALSETSFLDRGIRERQDLQRLLRDQIHIISPDTLVVSEEFGEWEGSRRRVDLLGIDKDANLIVIELKRTEDGGHMELQALRYAAMVSTLTFDKVVDVFDKYLSERGKEDDAKSTILDFLGWVEVDHDGFAQDVKIVLASAEFSKELTTSIMWLNDRDLDIKCIRFRPYLYGEKVLLDVQQVVPLPEVADYQVQIKEKKQKERHARSQSKDRSTYSISFKGKTVFEGFKKSDIGLNTVLLLEQRNMIDEDVFNYLREDKSCSFQLLKKSVEVTSTEKKYRKYRVNQEPELVFDGEGYYVARNWGVGNVEGFILKIKQRFPEIDYEQFEDGHFSSN